MPLTELCCLKPDSSSPSVMLLGNRGCRFVDLFVFRNGSLSLVKKKLSCNQLNDTATGFPGRSILGLVADQSAGWLIGSERSIIRLTLD